MLMWRYAVFNTFYCLDTYSFIASRAEIEGKCYNSLKLWQGLWLHKHKTYTYWAVYLSKKPICKKKCAALKKAIVKKDVKFKVAVKKWL